MARAPKPGAAKASAPTYFRVRLRDRTLEVPAQASIGEKFAVRAATGLPFEHYFAGDKFGEDSLCVLWWLARRHNGEPHLAWHAHLAEWPADLSVDDMDLDIVEDDGAPTDDPGKSVPA